MQHKKFVFTPYYLPAGAAFQFAVKSSSGSDTPETVTQPALPATAYNYVITYPAHIQNALLTTDNTPANNPITNDGATLTVVILRQTSFQKIIPSVVQAAINRPVLLLTMYNSAKVWNVFFLQKPYAGLNLRFTKAVKCLGTNVLPV